MLKFMHGEKFCPPKRPLFIVVPYNARPAYSFVKKFPDLGRIGAWLNRITGYTLRQFVAGNRDHAANPRDFSYQLGLVEETLRFCCPEGATIVAASAFAMQADAKIPTFCSLLQYREPESLSASELLGFDAIFLVCPDAIGLGGDAIERKVLSQTNAATYLVTGRRRVMRLSAPILRSLKIRRFLASTRLVEFCLTLCIVPLAAVLALYDALRGKT